MLGIPERRVDYLWSNQPKNQSEEILKSSLQNVPFIARLSQKLEREQHSHVYNRKNNSFIQRFSGFLSFAGALSVCIQTLCFPIPNPTLHERESSFLLGDALFNALVVVVFWESS